MKPSAATDQLRTAVETVLPVAVERGRLMGQIREALKRDDERRALELLRRYCNVEAPQ